MSPFKPKTEVGKDLCCSWCRATRDLKQAQSLVNLPPAGAGEKLMECGFLERGHQCCRSTSSVTEVL